MAEVWHIYADRQRTSELIAPDVRAKRYGSAITGRPCRAAFLHDPPRHADDVAWIEEYLPTWMCPGAAIHHIYAHDYAGAYSDSGQEK